MNGKENTQGLGDKLRNYYSNPDDELVKFCHQSRKTKAIMKWQWPRLETCQWRRRTESPYWQKTAGEEPVQEVGERSSYCNLRKCRTRWRCPTAVEEAG